MIERPNASVFHVTSQAKFSPQNVTLSQCSVTPGALYVFPKFVSQSYNLFVCLFELGLYYFNAQDLCAAHTNKLHFSIILCLDFKIPLSLDLSIPLSLDFKILLYLDSKILFYLDSKILPCLDFKILLCLDGILIATSGNPKLTLS